MCDSVVVIATHCGHECGDDIETARRVETRKTTQDNGMDEASIAIKEAALLTEEGVVDDP